MLCVAPVHHLAHPRKMVVYRFEPVEDGLVVYQRWIGFRMVREQVLPAHVARDRWKWLVKLGYRRP